MDVKAAIRELRSRALDSAGEFDSFERTIIEAGYSAHERYLDPYLQAAKTESERESLIQYWHETRKEYLGAAGCNNISPVGRLIPACAMYRSSLLDDMYARAVDANGGNELDFKRLENRAIEPCHRRIHELFLEGHRPDKESYLRQFHAEVEAFQERTNRDQAALKSINGSFGEALAFLSTKICDGEGIYRKRGGFHQIELPMKSLPGVSGYIWHESERPLRSGQLAFRLSLTGHGARISPSLPSDSESELRLGFGCLFEGFDAYGHFRNPSERGLCIAAHLYVGRGFFVLLDS